MSRAPRACTVPMPSVPDRIQVPQPASPSSGLPFLSWEIGRPLSEPESQNSSLVGEDPMILLRKECLWIAQGPTNRDAPKVVEEHDGGIPNDSVFVHAKVRQGRLFGRRFSSRRCLGLCPRHGSDSLGFRSQNNSLGCAPGPLLQVWSQLCPRDLSPPFSRTVHILCKPRTTPGSTPPNSSCWCSGVHLNTVHQSLDLVSPGSKNFTFCVC